MSLVVIAYPKISQQDYEWIQDIRRDNDPIMFNVVDPHITFIFPTNKLSVELLADHVQKQITNFKSFPIVLDKTKVVEDDSKTYTHTFLVPSIGFDEITRLHDLLYVGDMASELRVDIPFIPHLGIGTNTSMEVMQQLADSIDRSGKTIKGMIDELIVAEYDGKKVVELEYKLLPKL